MEEEICDELYRVVKKNDICAVREALSAREWDLSKHYGSEGNVVTLAIQNAGDGIGVLPALLGVDDESLPDYEGRRRTLDEEADFLLGQGCDSDGLLPLAKAAKVGSYACASFLISCGARVNGLTPKGERAIDFSLDRDDTRLTMMLLEKDSLFPNCVTRKVKLHSWIQEHDEFIKLFKVRDSFHRGVQCGRLDPSVTESLRKGKCPHFVDSNGASVLYKAGIKEKHDVWANLLGLGMQYSCTKEEYEVNELRVLDEDNFNRALEQVFCKVEGCHVIKMVSKSLVFGKYEDSGGLGKRIETIYKALDENDCTSVLLKVLQDVPDFDVVFDFGSTNVKRVRAKEFKDKIYGLSDINRNRVYVGAMETVDFDFGDVVSNLAHELAHIAMNVVFKNNSLPFKTEFVTENRVREVEEKNEGGLSTGVREKRPDEIYKEIINDILDSNRIKRCDEIIKSVKKYYGENNWGRELIVRVPEMVAKYRRRNERGKELPGEDLLKEQAPELLSFYKNYVMREFDDYIKDSYTKGKITLRAVDDYQQIVTSNLKDRIEVSPRIRHLEFYEHKNLKTMKVSNLALGQCHVRMKSTEKVFFVDWSIFEKCKSLFMEGLMRRDFEKLVVTWDREVPPKFCRKKGVEPCYDTCPAREFDDLVECVIMLYKESSALPEAQTVEYLWEDLSEKTQKMIKGKDLDFGGIKSTVRQVIQMAAKQQEVEQDVDEFASMYLDSSDISYLLEEKNLKLSKVESWPRPKDGEKIFLSHHNCFIERSLYSKYMDINRETVNKCTETHFFVGNVGAKYFLEHGITVTTWNVCNRDERARCYVMDQEADASEANDVFDDIVEYHKEKGTHCVIHFLKLRYGKFFWVTSEDLRGNTSINSNEPEFHLRSHYVKNILEQDDFFNDEAEVIADNPGCGKSVYLKKLAMDIKKKFPNSWVCFIELSVLELKKYLVNLDDFGAGSKGTVTEVEELFFSLVKSGPSSFERKLFGHFIRAKNRFFALFDGFDEICPRYKESVAAFLKALKSQTSVKIIVTTRFHEKDSLLRSLNSIAYTLVPFTTEEQVQFLSTYWNALLNDLNQDERKGKFQSMKSGITECLSGGEEIQGVVEKLESSFRHTECSSRKTPTKIDFGPVARILMKCGDIFTKGPEQFTRTPLHIQMVGLITFEDSFNTGPTINLGHLYIRFCGIKMKIFNREKVRYHGSVQGEMLMRMGLKFACEILENLAANLFQNVNVYEFQKSDIQVILGIGLITERANTYQFIHRTFAEYFFGKWLLRNANKEHVTKLFLEELFIEERLAGVRNIVEDILQLLSEGFMSSDNDNVLLIQKKSLLNHKVFPGVNN